MVFQLPRCREYKVVTILVLTICLSGCVYWHGQITAQVAPGVPLVERKVLAASNGLPPSGSTYGSVQSYHFSWDKYPVGEQERIGGGTVRVSSWPAAAAGGRDCQVNTRAVAASNGVGGTFNYGEYMMLPMPMADMVPAGTAYSGRMVGQAMCRGSISIWNTPDTIASTSAATPAPSWFDDLTTANSGGASGGAYIHPRAYGGWASDPNASIKLPFKLPAQRSGTQGGPEFVECGGLEKETANSSHLLDGAFRQSVYDQGGQSKPVWGTRCKEAQKLKEILTARHNAPQTDTNGANYIKSLGVTLFRQKFTLTSQQLEEIRQLDQLNDGRSGLYLRLAVDDYAAVYINGRPIFANPKQSTHVELKKVIADYLQPGDNVIALEVQDRIALTSLVDARAGARWLLGVYAPQGWEPIPGEPRLYGSWAEYGIMAPGKVVSSSGAGLSTAPEGRVGVLKAREYNDLTFQNQTNPFGKFYNLPPAMRSPDSYFAPTATLGGVVKMDDIATGVYQADNVTIDGGQIKRGRQVVIKATGTITIKGDIKQEGGMYAAPGDLPMLLMSARHVIIEPSVSQINAWLVAKQGSVNTCDTKVRDVRQWLSDINVAACHKQLRINGPVMASHLLLRRTFAKSGDRPGDNPGEPAEIFNLRPDSYMWGMQYSRQSGVIKTMYLKELPPRF